MAKFCPYPTLKGNYSSVNKQVRMVRTVLVRSSGGDDDDTMEETPADEADAQLTDDIKCS